jgi:hypothetical protein
MNPGARCRQRVVWRNLGLDSLSERLKPFFECDHRATDLSRCLGALVIAAGQGLPEASPAPATTPSLLGLGRFRIELDALAEFCDCFLEMSFGRQSISKIDVAKAFWGNCEK